MRSRPAPRLRPARHLHAAAAAGQWEGWAGRGGHGRPMAERGGAEWGGADVASQ